MAADEHINQTMLGPLFHGTPYRWKGNPSASYEQPFHAASHRSLAASYTDGGGSGIVKRFDVDPAAVVHRMEGDSPAGGGDPDAATSGAREARADLSVFSDGNAMVYNPAVLKHVKDERVD